MTNQIHRTLIITAEYREAARILIAAAAGEDQRGMLNVALWSEPEHDEEGQPVASHYMSTGNILATFADLLPLDEWDGEQYVRTKEPDYEAITAATGATQEHVEEVLGAALVTAEPWQVTLGRFGTGMVV